MWIPIVLIGGGVVLYFVSQAKGAAPAAVAPGSGGPVYRGYIATMDGLKAAWMANATTTSQYIAQLDATVAIAMTDTSLTATDKTNIQAYRAAI